MSDRNNSANSNSHSPEGQQLWSERLSNLIIRIFTPPHALKHQSSKDQEEKKYWQSGIISDKPIQQLTMVQSSLLQDSLQNFVSSTNDVEGAILVSPDGLSLASVLLANMDEERTAAISAAMLSLGEKIGQE